MTTATLAGLVLIGGFVLLLLMRVPISFAMLLATLGSALVTGTNFSVLVRQMVDGVNNFSLLSIPFFILMGEIMGAGGISAEEKQALLAVLRLLAAGNDAAMTAYARLEALWSAPQPPKENVFAVLGRAILGKMSLGRNE